MICEAIYFGVVGMIYIYIYICIYIHVYGDIADTVHDRWLVIYP